jgi:lipopolysaccharide transport system permease protein
VAKQGFRCVADGVSACGPSRPDFPETVIDSAKGWQSLNLAELWRFRELLWILAMRDLKTRYRQSMLGAAWMVIQPLLTLVVFTLFFRAVGGVPTSTSQIPYALSILSTILAWGLFSTSLSHAANSLPANAGLITKVYCPRLIFPLCCVITPIADFCIGLVVLAVAMGYYRIAPSWPILLLPCFMAMAAMCGLSVGLWLSSLSVRQRDFRFGIPTLLQVWFFASPVVYDVRAMVPDWAVRYYSLNPMVGILEGFRWSILGADTFSWALLGYSVPTFFALLVAGLFYFRKAESEMADFV